MNTKQLQQHLINDHHIEFIQKKHKVINKVQHFAKLEDLTIDSSFYLGELIHTVADKLGIEH